MVASLSFEAVLAFVSAESWPDSKRIVEEQRDLLLTDAADQVFALLLEVSQDKPNAIRILQKHRQLLARCRHEGIEVAFADLIHLTPSTPLQHFGYTRVNY